MSGEPFLGEVLALALAAPAAPPIVRAGRGDPCALRELANAACVRAQGPHSPARLANLMEALTFYRLAAAHGEVLDLHWTVTVFGELAATCRALGDFELADSFEGQGVLLAELAGEQGDDEMADLIARAAPKITPGAFREAHRLRKLRDEVALSH